MHLMGFPAAVAQTARAEGSEEEKPKPPRGTSRISPDGPAAGRRLGAETTTPPHRHRRGGVVSVLGDAPAPRGPETSKGYI